MPPTANMVSGNTSVCTTPALVASFSATLPGTAEACGVNASNPRTPRFGFGLRVRGRSVARRSAGCRECRRAGSCPAGTASGASTATAPITAVRPTSPCRSRATSDHRDERGRQSADAEHQLDGIARCRATNASTSTPATAARTRSASARAGRTRRWGWAGSSVAGPSASLRCRDRVWSIVVRVWSTAGLITSSTGFGYTPSTSSSAISGATTASSRGTRSRSLSLPSCHRTGPSSAGTATACRSPRAPGRSTRPPRTTG